MKKIFTHQKIAQILIWIVCIVCGFSFTHYIEENAENKFRQLIYVTYLILFNIHIYIYIIFY